jgi:multiple sugar transport system ATP-binding protein
VPKREIDRRVHDAARILHIEELLNRKPRQLSGGQRQRVALGRAIVREPAVFLFDEPLSNLDAKLRVQMRAEITKLHQRLGTTFVYVTHDQVEAMTMASRIAVMSNAQIQQVGSPQEIYEQPANLFVAGFIGSPAMNFFRVRLEGEPEDIRADGGTFQARIPDQFAAALRSYIHQEVILGIRPEHIHDQAFVPPHLETSSIRATVEVLELMGNEIFLYLRSGKHEFQARVDPRSKARLGDEIELAMDMARIHAFDPKTEEAIV